MSDMASRADQRGWLTWLGAIVTLVLIQGGMELWLFAPQLEQRDDLQRLMLRQERRLAQAQAQPAAESTFLRRLRGFESDLGQLPDTSARIAKLHDLAAQQGLSIKSANYKYSAEPHSLEKTVMQADLDGSYVALRRFIRAALAADPACGLDSLSIAQQAGGSPVLRIQLQLTLYAQPQATVQPSKAP